MVERLRKADRFMFEKEAENQMLKQEIHRLNQVRRPYYSKWHVYLVYMVRLRRPLILPPCRRTVSAPSCPTTASPSLLKWYPRQTIASTPARQDATESNIDHMMQLRAQLDFMIEGASPGAPPGVIVTSPIKKGVASESSQVPVSPPQRAYGAMYGSGYDDGFKAAASLWTSTPPTPDRAPKPSQRLKQGHYGGGRALQIDSVTVDEYGETWGELGELKVGVTTPSKTSPQPPPPPLRAWPPP